MGLYSLWADSEPDSAGTSRKVVVDPKGRRAKRLIGTVFVDGDFENDEEVTIQGRRTAGAGAWCKIGAVLDAPGMVNVDSDIEEIRALVEGGGIDEVQSIVLTGRTAGSFKLRYGGQTTASIAHNANAAAVQAALEALSSIGAGNVTCAGGALPGTPVTITFTGDLAGQNVAEITMVGVASLTTTTPGVAPVNEVQTLVVDAGGGTFDLTYSGQTAAGLAYNITAAALQTALEGLSNIGVGDVAVTGVNATGPGLTITFQGALAGTNVAQMTTNPASLTGGAGTATVATQTAGVAAVDEIQTLNLCGYDGGTFTLTYAGQTTTPIAWNASAATIDAALEALSNIGAGDVTTAGTITTGNVTVTFTGALAGGDRALMTVDAALLTSSAALVTTTTEGEAAAITAILATDYVMD